MPDLATTPRAVPALAIEGLTYAYPNAVIAPIGHSPHQGGVNVGCALREVSLTLAPGEFTLLAGRSACGKSTLLRAACGLVPHFHGGEIAGSINVAGQDAIAAGPGELAASVGYVAQDPETQVVSTTVAAEIELPLEMRGEPATARARAVEEVALALAIPHLLGRTVDTLSGGELQRVALAAALVTRPKLVLLDEPTSQLDPVAGDELIWLLRRLNEEWGVSILLAEHRLERCLAAADRVIAMDSGAIAYDGAPSDFLAWAQRNDTALETPAARLFSLLGIEPLPTGVRQARQMLRPSGEKVQAVRRGPDPRPSAAASIRNLWVELNSGDAPRDVLKGIDLTIGRGERVALMGRNGAGKSTLLRALAGLVEPVKGKAEAADGMALLSQNPSDYLVRERVGDELPGAAGMAALRTVGLEHAVDSDPRDLSGGERQRLALAIALAGRMEGDELPGLVALDEPTRGMDRARKQELVELVEGMTARGAGVVVATHDVEFAAAFAQRVVLLGDGVVIADGPATEILSGGWYFATEVARILDVPGVVTPEQGVAYLAAEEGGRVVTWELASFLILAAVLIGGFAWYERSRPTAQVVALVAALAALAIAGRIAFAAFPNVKPTTDIVVFAGYALGPAPGFAVGALTALVSNLWFGQGPWTPWQMAGWGMCGMLGAALAVVRPRPGRLTLAVVCGLAGLAYGALLNFSLMATYGGELSLERFLALQSRAVPFDLAHAVGNATLAFVAGPAMIRMLVRFRERFEWRVPAVASVLLLALALASVLPTTAQAAPADRAAGWLAKVQNADGGWGASPESESSPEITAWAMLGLEASGRNPLDVEKGGRNPVGFLRTHVDELGSPGDLARTILALKGAKVNPRSFGGRDLVEALAKLRRNDGSFEGWPGSTAFAVIALRAGGASGGLEPSISWLAKAQNGDGGWGDLPDSPSTADGTGAVLQAMPSTKAAEQGLGYLRRAQRPNGGFPLGGSGSVNSQSTAWAVQGMLAMGTDPGSVQEGGNSAFEYLATLQQPDGHYRYSASSDQTPVWVTGQVLTAVAGQSFPVTPVAAKPDPAPLPPITVPETTVPPAAGSTEGLPPSLGVPESVPPATGGGIPSIPPPASGLPGTTTPPATEGLPSEGTTPESPAGLPANPPFEASPPPAPEPWAPVGVGLGTGGLALGSVLLLGRRFGW